MFYHGGVMVDCMPCTILDASWLIIMAIEKFIGTSVFVVHDKPFKFEGRYFKCWRQKVRFFLTIKKIASILTEDIPVVPS